MQKRPNTSYVLAWDAAKQQCGADQNARVAFWLRLLDALWYGQLGEWCEVRFFANSRRGQLSAEKISVDDLAGLLHAGPREELVGRGLAFYEAVSSPWRSYVARDEDGRAGLAVSRETLRLWASGDVKTFRPEDNDRIKTMMVGQPRSVDDRMLLKKARALLSAGKASNRMEACRMVLDPKSNIFEVRLRRLYKWFFVVPRPKKARSKSVKNDQKR